MNSKNTEAIKDGIVPIAEVTLDDPITMGQDTYREVKITHKPTLGDMDGLSLSEELDSTGLSLLLGRISNLPTPAVKNMTLLDVGKVMEIVKPFLPSTPKSGG